MPISHDGPPSSLCSVSRRLRQRSGSSVESNASRCRKTPVVVRRTHVKNDIGDPSVMDTETRGRSHDAQPCVGMYRGYAQQVSRPKPLAFGAPPLDNWNACPSIFPERASPVCSLSSSLMSRRASACARGVSRHARGVRPFQPISPSPFVGLIVWPHRRLHVFVGARACSQSFCARRQASSGSIRRHGQMNCETYIALDTQRRSREFHH